MFENETYENILNRMLARFPSTIDKREGSVLRDLLSPKAIELAQAYASLDRVLDYTFATTTYGEYLDRKVAERGIFRKAGKAKGPVNITVPTGTEVVEGTRVSTNEQNPVYFTTTETVVAVNDSAIVTVEAEEIGEAGNVLAGTVTVIYGGLADIATITNPETFTGGINEESDEELLQRYLEDVQKPTTSGNKNDYVKWAKEVPGIADAKCYPKWNGVGTVKVVVINPQKRSPAQSVLNEVANYIESVRPALADVTVVGVNEVSIDINVKLTLKSGTDLENVRTTLTSNVIKYFESMAFEETDDYKVRYTAIGNAILDATGVIDYSDLKINNLTSNIALTETEVPVIGAVTITTE